MKRQDPHKGAAAVEDRAPAAPAEDTAARYGIEFLPTIPDSMLDPALVSDLPVEWARSHALLPVRMNGSLCVACADPDAVSDQEYLSLLLGADLHPVLAPAEEILKAIERCYFRRENTPGDFLRDLEQETGAAAAGAAAGADLLQVAEKAPVTQLVNLILLDAVRKRASDVHLEPFESRLRVRYRIDGVLYEQTSPPKHLEEALVSRVKVMARMDIAERRLPQDGMAKVRVGAREIDIRASTVPVAEGERVVLRLLDRESALLPLTSLGMADAMLEDFRKLLAQPNGIVIVSGPTGSGKTTTLYAALSELDASRRNIMTIEDPIEYQLPDIGQIQVKPKIGLTFSSGLRHILRQDPDVVLVGETRDIETAEIALRASLTGHLVFTTLHTNDAPGAVLRLVEMGVEPYLLSSCLRGVLAQRLVRTLCGACKTFAPAAARDLAALGPDAERNAGKPVGQAVGCDRCLEGYSGRIGLFELMLLGPDLQELVRTGRVDGAGFRAAAARHGMRPLSADGLAKALAGVTSLAEASLALGSAA